MSPLDALRRLQFPSDLSPSQEEDIHIQEEITLGEGSTLLLESEAEEEEEEEAQTNDRKTTEWKMLRNYPEQSAILSTWYLVAAALVWGSEEGSSKSVQGQLEEGAPHSL